MASKASMLKQGANKTGKGLFNGMAPLNVREEAEPKQVEVTNVIPKEEKVTEVVKEIQEPVVETPIQEKEIAPVVVEEPIPAPVEEPKPVVIETPTPRDEINVEINKAKNDDKKAAEKPASRYEKEKFLLLDVRGYRDYVEHMAKAANMSATKYIRNLIQQDMDKNLDIYEAHKALEEKLKGRTGN